MTSYTNYNNNIYSNSNDHKNKNFRRKKNLGNNYISKFGSSKSITDSSLNKYYKKYMRNQLYILHEKKVYELIEQLDDPKVFRMLKEEYDKEKEIIRKSSSINQGVKRIDFSSQCINLNNYKSKTDKQFKQSLQDYDFMYALMNFLRNRPKKIKKPKINQNLLKLYKNPHHKSNDIIENNTKKTYPNLKALLKMNNTKEKERRERRESSLENDSPKINNQSKRFSNFNTIATHDNMNITSSLFNQTNYTNIYNNTNYNNYNSYNNNENVSHKNSIKMDFSSNNSITLNNNYTEENPKIRYSMQLKKTISNSSRNASSLQKKINSINPNIFSQKSLSELKGYDKYSAKKKLIKKYKSTMNEFLQKIKSEERNLYSNGDKISKLINISKKQAEISLNNENEKNKNYVNRNNNNQYNKIMIKSEKTKNKTSLNFFNANSKFNLPILNKLIYGADEIDSIDKFQLELYSEVKKNLKKKIKHNQIKIYSKKTGKEMIENLKLLHNVKSGKIIKKNNDNGNENINESDNKYNSPNNIENKVKSKTLCLSN